MRKAGKILSLFIVLLFVAGIAGLVWAGEAEKININTASEKELTQLEGIGPAKAAEIVKYREKNGAFGTPEDLMKVKGIGEKTFKANKDRIVAGEPNKKVSEETKAPEKGKKSEASDQKISEETKASEKEKISEEADHPHKKVSEEKKDVSKKKKKKSSEPAEGKEEPAEE